MLSSANEPQSDFAALEQVICDEIKEAQIKLGYRSETIRLYYPLRTLNILLGTELSAETIRPVLEGFADHEQERMGRIEISVKGERFCLKFPPQTSEYVHREIPASPFLKEFIGRIYEHGITADAVFDIFRRYSEHVRIVRTSHDEFDWLVYFEDGIPDAYRYCLKDEGCHLTYHRYTEADYRDFGFEEA